MRHAQPEVPSSGRPVLIVAGFNSTWNGGGSGDALGDNFDERRFSYRGLDAHGRPLPYGPRDTHRSLPALVREMDRQVDVFRAATGQDIDIVADSEGSLVAAAYVAAVAGDPVDRTLLISPLIEPGRVAFPERGADGWGVVTGWVLRGVSASVRAVTSVELAPDTPFARSLIDEAPVLARPAPVSSTRHRRARAAPARRCGRFPPPQRTRD